MLPIYQTQLENLGLTPSEVSVYLNLVQFGPGTASEVAQRCNLNRSTAYVQLSSLINDGLVNNYKLKKKTCFSAESPKHLERFLEKKLHTIEDQIEESGPLIEDLLKIFAKNDTKPSLRVFDGKDGLITMGNELLNSGVPEYYAAYSFDEIYAVFGQQELANYNEKRVALGIFEHLLYNKSGRAAPKLPLQEQKRFPKDTFPFRANIYVYGDTVSIAQTTGKIFGVSIKNENVANSFRSLFKLAWSEA